MSEAFLKNLSFPQEVVLGLLFRIYLISRPFLLSSVYITQGAGNLPELTI